MHIQFSIRMAAAGLALAFATATASAEVVLVVSPKSSVSSLTAEQVSEIFLGKATAFPGGGNAEPYDQIDNAAPRQEFYGKVVGKNPAQLKAYWAKQIFTGNGHPPKEVADNNAVRAAVAGNANAIGYMDKSAVDGSVKVIAVSK